jgi:hypothetical protein
MAKTRKSTYSFEEIDSHINKLHIPSLKRDAAVSASLDAGSVLQRVCTIWQGVRPIVVSLSSFFFVPRKWREAMNAFTAVLDSLCP